MGRFSQKGLCYSFEILQGFLSNNEEFCLGVFADIPDIDADDQD